MDVIPFTLEVDDEFKCKLNIIQQQSSSNISIHGSNILIAPSDPLAKSMVDSLIRVTSVTEAVDTLVPFNGPIKAPIIKEVEKVCGEKEVEFVVKKKGIVLIGQKKVVAIVRPTVAFLSSLNSSPSTLDPAGNKSINSPEKTTEMRPRDEFGRFKTDATPKKPKRREHRCPFCKKDKDSSTFRKHIVSHCKKATSRYPNEERKHMAVDKFYRIRITKQSTAIMPSDLDTSFSSDSDHDSRTTKNIVNEERSFIREVSSSVPPDNGNDKLGLNFRMMSISSLMESFQSYGESCFSGKKKHHKTSTKKAKISSLEKVIEIGQVKNLSDLCEEMDKVVSAIDNLQTEYSGKYKLVEAIIDFLNYVKLEKQLAVQEQMKLSNIIERWDRARQYFQRGLVADRISKKKKDTDDMERGNFPSLYEVFQFSEWLKKFTDFDFSKSISKKDLQFFYVYVAANLILSTIIRPSSFCRMEKSDFESAVSKFGKNGIVHLVRVMDCKASLSNAGFVLFTDKVYKLCQSFLPVRPMSDSKEMFVDCEGKPLDSGRLFNWCEKLWNKWRHEEKLIPKKFGFTKLRKSAHTDYAGKNGFGDLVFALGAGHRYASKGIHSFCYSFVIRPSTAMSTYELMTHDAAMSFYCKMVTLLNQEETRFTEKRRQTDVTTISPTKTLNYFLYY